MGLDTTHDCWHGAYSSFGAFRSALADAAIAEGVTFLKHGGHNSYSYSLVEEYPQRCFYGWWDDDRPYSDPLEVLFVHSDCEGYIFPNDLGDLIDRLERLAPRVAKDWQEDLEQFLSGLRSAWDECEIVEFR